MAQWSGDSAERNGKAGTQTHDQNKKGGPVIADHTISHERGKLIQDRQHTHDRTKGIPAYIASVAEKFENTESAHDYLEEVQRRYPRYIRDQLGLIAKVLQSDPVIRNEALEECVRGLYSATEFSDVVQHIKRQRQVNSESKSSFNAEWKPLYAVDESVIRTKPQTRDIDEYIALLEGGVYA